MHSIALFYCDLLVENGMASFELVSAALRFMGSSVPVHPQ